MRARVLACACALWAAGCLYPEYSVTHDGGAAGAGGRGGSGSGGRGGGAIGAAGAGGSGGSAVGVAGSAGGAAGAAAGSAGSAGTAGNAGNAGSTGAAGTTGAGGSSAGRGGTTGAAGSTAGTGGGAAGRGGTTGAAGSAGTGGGAAGRGGTGGSAAGTGGSAGRGGSSGTGGSAAGTGGSGTGGSTVAPSWLSSIAVVYQFDGQQGQLGAEAHGDETLHMEEDAAGSILPMPDSVNAIEGGSGKLTTLNGPAYFRSKSGAGLPSVFQTEPGTSFTMGGWFRVDSSLNAGTQFLINDEGPGAYVGGFVFYLDQDIGSFSTNAAYAYCRIGTSGGTTDFNYKEVQTNTIIGPDPVVGVAKRWAHLVCRYDATSNQLSIFVAGVREAVAIDATHPIKTGPGPFIVGCDTSFCQFLGNVDEVFYATSALSDLDVARIYACGIDGARCRCNGTSWANCGFMQSGGCGPTMLPACNANP